MHSPSPEWNLPCGFLCVLLDRNANPQIALIAGNLKPAFYDKVQLVVAWFERETPLKLQRPV